MVKEKNAISNFDKKFQHEIIESLSHFEFPYPETYNSKRLLVADKDQLFFSNLLFIKKHYSSFAKWAYSEKKFDFNTFLGKQPSESVFKIYFEIFLAWGKLIALHVITLLTNFKVKEKINKSNTIFMLFGFEDYLFQENESMLDYLVSFTIKDPSSSVQKIIVICNKEEVFKFKDTSFIFTANLRKLAMKSISIHDLFNSFIETGRIVFYLLQIINKHKYLSDSVDEYIKSPFLAYGINKYAQEIVLTNSLSHEPPLFVYFKNKESHVVSCLWYSADYFSYQYSPSDKSILPLTAKYFRVDRNYFWTNIQKILAKEAGYESEIINIAPAILQKNSLRIKKEADVNVTEVCLFNIIPFFREHLANCGYPQDHYVNLERCTLFLEDICEVVDEIRLETGARISILLKQKRAKNPVHRNEYYETISKLVETKRIILLDHDSDMESLLKNTDLSISQPFSTPFFISRELGLPAYFYDPTSELVPCHTLKDGELLNGKEQLKRVIKSYVKF